MQAAQQVFAGTPRPKTFVELVRNRDGLAVHLVKTYDHAQRPCWFLLRASERHLVKLERTEYEEMIDLTQYGEVVASGWGHKPDEDALKRFFGPKS